MPGTEDYSDKLHEDLLHHAESLGFTNIAIKLDEASQLRAIIALHNTERGPAIGGCRCIAYPSSQEALEDALRLAKMMSYKAALAGLPHGGGKAVLIKPDAIKDRSAYFQAFGDFVETLQGSYVTAVDSGTTRQDMDLIARRTQHVVCTTKDKICVAEGSSKGSSWYTALGVFHGIRAAVAFAKHQDTLHDIHVGVQGVGNVGYYLVGFLVAAGARVTIADTNSECVSRCLRRYRVNVVPAENLLRLECDVLSLCALGGVLNPITIPRLQASILVGAANNQLSSPEDGVALHERGILYAPDFAVNSGGLMYAAAAYRGAEVAEVASSVGAIYNRMIRLFERAQRESLPMSTLVDSMALEVLSAKL